MAPGMRTGKEMQLVLSGLTIEQRNTNNEFNCASVKRTSGAVERNSSAVEHVKTRNLVWGFRSLQKSIVFLFGLWFNRSRNFLRFGPDGTVTSH